MKVLKAVSMTLLLVFAFSMISGATAAQTISLKNNQMNVHVNEKFVINLTSNPSTGYLWTPIYNKKYIKGVSNTFTPNKNSDIVGGAGVQRMVFLPTNAGETTIIFKYFRPWDKQHPDRTIVLHLTISK